MDKEQHINGMAYIIHNSSYNYVNDFDCKGDCSKCWCTSKARAGELYDAGCRMVGCAPNPKGKVVDYQSAVAYLQNVISKWDMFCKSHQELAKAIQYVLMGEPATNQCDTCVVCGIQIPEGRQICPNCEKKGAR